MSYVLFCSEKFNIYYLSNYLGTFLLKSALYTKQRVIWGYLSIRVARRWLCWVLWSTKRPNNSKHLDFLYIRKDRHPSVSKVDLVNRFFLCLRIFRVREHTMEHLRTYLRTLEYLLNMSESILKEHTGTYLRTYLKHT